MTGDIIDIGLVTGYQCAGCRTTLVSTEGKATQLGAKAGA